jgi:hypothetical protein
MMVLYVPIAFSTKGSTSHHLKQPNAGRTFYHRKPSDASARRTPTPNATAKFGIRPINTGVWITYESGRIPHDFRRRGRAVQ